MSSLVQLGYAYNSGERRACVVVVPPHLSLDDVAVEVLSPSRVSRAVPVFARFRAVSVLARPRELPCIVVCCSVSLLCAAIYVMYWCIGLDTQLVNAGPP